MCESCVNFVCWVSVGSAVKRCGGVVPSNCEENLAVPAASYACIQDKVVVLWFIRFGSFGSAPRFSFLSVVVVGAVCCAMRAGGGGKVCV